MCKPYSHLLWAAGWLTPSPHNLKVIAQIHHREFCVCRVCICDLFKVYPTFCIDTKDSGDSCDPEANIKHASCMDLDERCVWWDVVTHMRGERHKTGQQRNGLSLHLAGRRLGFCCHHTSITRLYL